MALRFHNTTLRCAAVFVLASLIYNVITSINMIKTLVIVHSHTATMSGFITWACAKLLGVFAISALVMIKVILPEGMQSMAQTVV